MTMKVKIDRETLHQIVEKWSEKLNILDHWKYEKPDYDDNDEVVEGGTEQLEAMDLEELGGIAEGFAVNSLVREIDKVLPNFQREWRRRPKTGTDE
jgi:hypothetical protein